MFNYVKEIYDELRHDESGHQLEVPFTGCSSEKPILQNNERFFIAHTLIDDPQNQQTDDQLIKHLNNCYECFQIYSQFYKDYFQASQEIRQTLGEKK